MKNSLKLLVTGLLLTCAAVAMANIPFFWLDKPTGRDNKNDPNSPLFVRTNTPGPSGPVNTVTITPTLTQTMTTTPTTVVACAADYSFEGSAQGWVNDTTTDLGIVSAAVSSTLAHCGAQSMALGVQVPNGASTQGAFQLTEATPTDLRCKTVTAWLYVPAGMSANASAQLFAQAGPTWAQWISGTSLNLPTTAGWVQLTMNINASGSEDQVQRIGLQILQGTGPAINATFYFDGVVIANNGACSIPGSSPTATPTMTPSNTPAATATPTVTPTAGNKIIFDDFETSAWVPSPGAWMYATWSSSATASGPTPENSMLPPGGGTNAIMQAITFSAGGLSEITLKSEYGSGGSGGPVAVTAVGGVGTLAIQVQVYSDVATTIGFYVNNASPSNQNHYTGPAINVSAGSWQTITVPLVASDWDLALSPFDFTAINNVIMDVAPTSGLAAVTNFYFDNMEFVPYTAPPASPTPTFTPTPTPTAGAVVNWPIVYNGDTVALGTNFYTAGGVVGGTEVTSAGQGAGGSNTYTHLTLSCAVAEYAAAGVFATGFTAGGDPLTYDATAYNSISISVRVPSSGGNCVIPAASLLCYDSGTGVTKTSGSVSVEPYLIGGAKFLQADTWYTALIPITAFEKGVDGTGFNGKPAPSGFTLTASDFTKVDGVQVEPANYGGNGAMTGAIDVDDVIASMTSSTLITGNRTGLFADFENGAAADYGGYWSANVDAFTATDCPGYVVPPASPNLSAMTYAGITDTTGAMGSDTPCHVGRLAGWMGAENASYGSPACTNVNAFPYLNMSANLTNDGAAHSLANNSFITTLPASGATGMKFKLKMGPTLNTEMAGQVIKVFIEKTAANQGDQFSVQIAVADLSDGNWHSYDVPFPTGAVAARHADQASGGTELNWMKTQYAGGVAPDAFDLTDVYQIGYGPIVRGKGFDILIDDILFY